MKACCDLCRGKLGLMVHRYWHMRFCSSACAQRYEQRLDEIKTSIRQLGPGGLAEVNGLTESSAEI